jgi:predicted HicB family RNase H-like nuclease
MPKQKIKKAGRPPLPKGEAKAKTLHTRLTASEWKAYEAAAKAKNQSVSDWIRSTLNAAV